ncbi:unnamed protein product [Closterium sp. Yama58-4]|nr:unnamed protein product [Closterium sp. Yama58-4]
MGDRTVHVGNLETFVNESTLYLLFSQFGTVTNVRLAGDPKMQTRYAFVEFNDSVMAHAACLLDGLQVGSRNLRVSLSKPYAGKGAASAAVQNPLAALMGGAGLAATPAVSAPRKRSTVEDQERISRTIHVRNVDIQITEAMLVEYFGVCGTVTAARTAGTGNPRTAWIEFAAQQSALAALSLDGQVLAGQTLRISPSKSAIQTNALSQRNAPPAALPTMTPAMMMAAVAAPQNIVKVQGIPAKASEADVRALVEGRCGHVRSLIIVPVPGPPPEEPSKEKGEKGEEGGDGDEGYKGPTKMATVEVEDAGAVAKALELNGTKFMGATISYAQAQTPQQQLQHRQTTTEKTLTGRTSVRRMTKRGERSVHAMTNQPCEHPKGSSADLDNFALPCPLSPHGYYHLKSLTLPVGPQPGACQVITTY